MALTAIVSQKELERQFIAGLQGKNYSIFLANNTTGLTAESTYTAWAAAEVTGGGYARATGTLAAGTYNATTQRFELSGISAVFTCTSGTYLYNTICVYLNGETYLHSTITESPNITLATGQSKTYNVTFIIDD